MEIYVLMRWVVGVVPKLKLTPLTFLRLFHSGGLFHPGVMNHSKNRNGWKVSLYFVKWEDCERSLGEGKKTNKQPDYWTAGIFRGKSFSVRSTKWKGEGSGSLFLKIMHIGTCSLKKSSCTPGVQIHVSEDHWDQWLSTGMVLLPRVHLAMSGESFGCHRASSR